MNRGNFTAEILNYIWILQHKGKTGGKILDCGAGGRHPKMSLLQNHGFNVEGIEIEDSAINSAITFAKEQNITLKIQKADMRSLPYSDDTFDGVYSYNSIFHMTKRDIEKSVKEMIRVLKPGGIGYLNFLGILDDLQKTGIEKNPGEFTDPEREHGEMHTLLSEKECEGMLTEMNLIEKNNQVIKLYTINPPYQGNYIDYYFEKTK